MAKKVISFVKEEQNRSNDTDNGYRLTDFNKAAIQNCYGAMYDYLWGQHGGFIVDDEKYEADMANYYCLYHIIESNRVCIPKNIYNETVHFLEDNMKPLKVDKEWQDDTFRQVDEKKWNEVKMQDLFSKFEEFADKAFYPALVGLA